MDAVLLFHHRDILYYAGTVRPAVLFVATASRLAVLLVRRGLPYVRQETTIGRVESMQGFDSLLEIATEFELDGDVIGTELDLLPAKLYQRLQETFPDWSLANVTPLVMAQRAIKDRDEIAVTRQAAVVADAGHQAARQAIAPGVSELALAAEVEAAMRRAGHEGFQPLRYPEARGAGVLLMSGEHLSVRGGHGLVVTGMGLGPAMPYGPSRRVLEPGDLVVVDIGSTYGGYTADESRTFVVGRATAAQRALFGVARAAEEAVFRLLSSGVPIADLYAAAEEMVAVGARPYYEAGSLMLPGFVGHGIGLELDESPVLWPRDEGQLKTEMVLAIEVEVNAPEQGTMVKLEDTVVVRSDGYELLTEMPRELIECNWGRNDDWSDSDHGWPCDVGG